MVYLLDRECTSSEIRYFDDFAWQNSPKSDPELIQNPRITFACLVSILFFEKRQTRKYRNEKRSKRAESAVRCGDFGTYASAQLPIGFENGPMQVENSTYISAKERCAVKISQMQRNAKET